MIQYFEIKVQKDNSVMEKYRFDEIEINLMDVIWTVLEQWRGLLLAGLVFSLLFFGGTCIKEMTSPTNVESTGKKETTVRPPEKSPINIETEYSNICNALYNYSDYYTLKQAYEQHVRTKLDFSDSYKASYIYEYYADSPQTLLLLNSAYSLLLNDNVFLKTIRDNIASDADINSIKSLLSVSVSSNANLENGTIGVLVVSATLPGTIDSKAFKEVMSAAVIAYKEEIMKKTSTHSIHFIIDEYTEIGGIDQIRADNVRYKEFLTANNTYGKSLSSLSEPAQDFIKQIISNTENPNYFKSYIDCLDKKWEQYVSSLIEKQNVTDVEELAKLQSLAEAKVTTGNIESSKSDEKIERIKQPSFVIKTLIIGFILGCFLYSFIFMIFFVMKRVVRNEDDLQSVTGIRNFGGIYKYPYTKKWQVLLHDIRIYERRHKNTVQPLKIIDDLIVKMSYQDLEALTLITVGCVTPKVQSIIALQVEQLQNKGKNIKEVHVSARVAEEPDIVFQNMENAFIVLIGNLTKWASLESLLNKTEEYQILVLGSEYLEM